MAKYINQEGKVQSGNDEEYMYRLKGVVIHEGSADSGHYYSLIKDEHARWLEFNDNNVTTFDIQKLQEEAFGSKEEDDSSTKNAYLLFY